MDSGFWGRTKPPAGVPLNPSHPLSDGVILCVPFDRMGTPVDISPYGQRVTTTNGATVPGGGEYGSCPDFGAGGKDWVFQRKFPGFLVPIVPVTVFALFYPTAAKFQSLWQVGELSDSNFALSFGTHSTGALKLTGDHMGSGGGWECISSLVPSLNQWHAVGCAQSGQAARTFMLDGVLSANTTSMTNNVIGTGQAHAVGRGYLNGAVASGDDVQGKLALLIAWNRCTSAQELTSLAAAPFQMFAPPVWRRYFVPAGGGVNATLDAVAMTATAASPVAAVTGSAIIAAAAMTATAAEPTAAIKGNATLSAAAMTATAMSPSATVATSASMVGAVMTATGTSPNAAIGGSAALGAAEMAATATAPIAALAGNASMSAAAMTASALSPASTVAVSASIVGAAMTATALSTDATAALSASMVAQVMTASATSPTAALNGGASLSAAEMTASAASPASAIAGSAGLSAAVMTATAASPDATATLTASFVAQSMTASATSPTAAVSGGASISAEAMTASASSPAAALAGNATLSVAAMVASALSPDATAILTASIVASEMTASATSPTAAIGGAATLASVAMTASALAPDSAISGGAVASAEVMTASATSPTADIVGATGAGFTAVLMTASASAPDAAIQASSALVAESLTATATSPTASLSGAASLNAVAMTATATLLSDALYTDLISYWQLDEASGDALDSHGANTLTDTNTVGIGTGKISGDRDFERDTAEYFVHASNAELTTGDIDFSISAWVRFESGSNGSTRTVVAKNSLTDHEFELAMIQSAGAKRMLLSVNDPGGANTTFINTTVLSLSTWYHVVAWHDAVNNELGIAINDVAQTQSYSAGIGTSPTGSWYIGSEAHAHHFDGMIDEVGFWKRVLVVGERTQLYNGGLGLAYPFAGPWRVSSSIIAVSLTAIAASPTASVAGGASLAAGSMTATGSAPDASVAVASSLSASPMEASAESPTAAMSASAAASLAAVLMTATALSPSGVMSGQGLVAAMIMTAAALSQSASIALTGAMLASLMQAQALMPAAVMATPITGPRGTWQASPRKHGTLGSDTRKQGDFGASGRKRGTWEDES